MLSVGQQSMNIYRDLSVNERINMRAHFQGSAMQRENYNDVPMMSLWGIIGAVQFAITWGWYWE